MPTNKTTTKRKTPNARTTATTTTTKAKPDTLALLAVRCGGRARSGLPDAGWSHDRDRRQDEGPGGAAR
jgi:hypothetical protein